MEQEKEPLSWHLDKRWHILQIIAALSICLTGVVWIVQRDAQFDKRVSMLENITLQQRERDQQQDREMASALEALHKQLDRIESKIERAVDRDFQLNGKR